MLVDAFATEPHYVDHIAPVWRALSHSGAPHGTFYAARAAVPRARAYGIAPCPAPAPPPDGRPILVAGYLDELRCKRRPVAMIEHGAGQHFGPRHAEGVGISGQERPNTTLHLVPNEMVGSLRRATYPHAAVAVVGSPRVDELLAVAARGPERLTEVAFSWHWEATRWPESRSALEHYRAGFRDAVEAIRAAGWGVLGHAHPRALGTVRRLYEACGVEVVPDFDTVAQRAAVYACDNSSTLYEFAALGRPVVVMNAPWYRRDVEHGLRFWSHAAIGPHVDDPADLAATVVNAADHPERARADAERLLRDVFVGLGTLGAAERAAEAVVAWASDPPPVVKVRSSPKG